MFVNFLTLHFSNSIVNKRRIIKFVIITVYHGKNKRIFEHKWY